MAIGGGMGPMGGQPAGLDINSFGRGFSAVTVLDVIIAHSPLWFSLATGFVAGALLWLIPAALMGFNSLLTWVSSGAPPNLFYLRGAAANLPVLVAASGALGVFLAFLRRLSARAKRYVTVGNMSLAFNSAFSTIGGLLIAIWLAASGSAAGIAVWLMGLGAPVIGFIVDGLWQMFHNLVLRIFGRPDMDTLLSIEAENFIVRHPGLGRFVLKRVKVESGTALVTGEWEDKATMDAVQRALLCIDGIDRVRFERAE